MSVRQRLPQYVGIVLLLLLLTSSCVETGSRREELKPFDDGHYCMDLAHDCSLCGGKTLDSPCDSCFKYKALCK